MDPVRTIEGFLTSVTAAHQRFVVPQAIHADARFSLRYRFADTIARFNLNPIGPAPESPSHIWARLEDARIDIGPPEAPRFSIACNDLLYLDTPLPPSIRALLVDADPDAF